ncbi:hypothetical protein [uncultured Brachyspira sp.]|uniref:hypothetical protein n=1 Tax=uncultured Brachyspira sp. TaxID=221953 RepID=UPI00260546C7|nr:hypothetical protein [uncultured Brachyspira sp.]
MRNTASISIIISLFLKVIFTFSLIYLEIAKNTGNIILGITKNSNDILIYLSAFLSMMMTILIWYNLVKGNRKMEKISEGMYEFAKTSFDMYMIRKQKNIKKQNINNNIINNNNNNINNNNDNKFLKDIDKQYKWHHIINRKKF